jgi:tagaturonate reductase
MALAVGCRTVLDAVRNDALGRYLRRVLHDEIVPSLTAPNGEAFALDVLTRFANPYLRHALTDITLQQTAKMRVRVVPSVVRCAERTGNVPASLAFGFAAYLFVMRASVNADGESRLPLAADNEGERVREQWRATPDPGEQSIRDVVQRICADAALWQTDLTRVVGFVERVASDLIRMTRAGVAAALAAHLEAHASLPKSVASTLPLRGAI